MRSVSLTWIACAVRDRLRLRLGHYPGDAPSLSDLAAASRAYRHLRWRDPGAVEEAYHALARLHGRDAPALAAAISAAITEAAASRLHLKPDAWLRAEVARELHRELTASVAADHDPADVDEFVARAEELFRAETKTSAQPTR